MAPLRTLIYWNKLTGLSYKSAVKVVILSLNCREQMLSGSKCQQNGSELLVCEVT